MSVEEVLFEFVAVLVVVIALGGIVVAANLSDRDSSVRWRRAVLISLSLMNGMIILLYGVMQLAQAYFADADAADVPQKSAAWGAFGGALIVSGLATVLLSYQIRVKIAFLFPRLNRLSWSVSSSSAPDSALTRFSGELAWDLTPKPGQPLFPQMLNYYTNDRIAVPVPRTAPQPSTNAYSPYTHQPVSTGFDPQSTVHMVALIFVVYMLGVQFVDFILAGGLSGIAENLENSINGWSLLINMLPLVVLPVLGVGFLTRRPARATLERLGIGLPSPQGLTAAAGLTVALFIMVALISGIWMGLVSETTFEEQTEASDALSEGVTTLGLAFLLALTAAIGEEIAFRGALQPVLGFWPTALIFALTHAQYTFTPAWLIIFGVAIAFGWIRRRYNTTVAMITHFAYNFIPLAIAVYAPDQTAAWLHWLF